MARTRNSDQKLLEAALAVFAAKGYASASVADIIKKAGVARGTFYLYFESKRAAFEQVLAHVISQMESIAPGPEVSNRFPSPLHLYERIRTSYERFLALFHRNAAFARIVFTEAIGLDRGFDAQLAAHYADHRANIRRFLEGVRASGLARDFNIDFVTEAIIGYAERCARMFTNGTADAESIKVLAAEMADFEFAAICRIPLEEIKRSPVPTPVHGTGPGSSTETRRTQRRMDTNERE